MIINVLRFAYPKGDSAVLGSADFYPEPVNGPPALIAAYWNALRTTRTVPYLKPGEVVPVGFDIDLAGAMVTEPAGGGDQTALWTGPR